MKKITYFGTGVIVGIILVSFIALAGMVGYIQSHYTRTAIVYEIQRGGVVKVRDENNNRWTFDGEGYTVGDKVALKMYTNHTDSNIYDDEIISVKIVDTLK